MFPILFLVALVVLVALTFWLYRANEDPYGAPNSMLLFFANMALGLFTAASSVAYVVLIYGWFAAEHKANIINREYGTQYTQAEIFYASDVVNIVKELNRTRIEVNGDFRRERDPQRNLRKDEK
jgi:hypothetical protein